MKYSNLIIAFIAMLVLSCGSRHQALRPAESATAQSPTGYQAAAYVIEADGEFLGEAKVWSKGATLVDTPAGKRTRVHVGLEVENHTEQELQLDEGRIVLEGVTRDERRFAAVAPAEITGPITVAPNAVEQLDLQFFLPFGLRPDDIGGLRMRWALSQDGQQYVQHTPFLRDEPVAYRGATVSLYYSPFWDPYLYYYPGYRTIIIAQPHRHVRRYDRPRRVEARPGSD